MMHPSWPGWKVWYDPGRFLYRHAHYLHHKSYNPGPVRARCPPPDPPARRAAPGLSQGRGGLGLSGGRPPNFGGRLAWPQWSGLAMHPVEHAIYFSRGLICLFLPHAPAVCGAPRPQLPSV